ncbi:hypothetical protein ACEPPN_001341 [Leptodophora sp. 'Broadleaf-Isolate-01']
MAAVSFLSQPQIQLQDPEASEEAVLICHSYAGALLTHDVLCFLFLVVGGSQIFDGTSAMLAASLAVYHVFPMRRAWVRLQRRKGNYKPEEKAAGGSPGHFVIHGALFWSLVWAAYSGIVF